MKIASATAVFQVMLRRPRRVGASASRVDRMPGLGSWQLLRWGIPSATDVSQKCAFGPYWEP